MNTSSQTPGCRLFRPTSPFTHYLSQQQTDALFPGRTRFTESVVWNKLYPFQQDGVKGIITEMEQQK